MASVYHEYLGNDKYKLVYQKGSRDNRIRKSKNIKIVGGTKRAREKILDEEKVKYKLEVEEKLKNNTDYYYDDRPFRELLQRWLELKEASVSPRTFEFYEGQINTRFIPKFGRKKTKNITILDIQSYYTELLTTESRLDGKKGSISPNTVRKYHTTLGTIFGYAFKKKMISEDIMEFVTPPKKVKFESKELDLNDLNILFNSLLKQDDLLLKVIVLLGITTGARRGEIASLRWNDIDMDNSTVSITRTVSNVKKDRYIDDPKSGKRKIILPEIVMEHLKELYARECEKKMLLGLEWLGEDNIKDNYILTNETGYWIRADTISNKWYRFRNKIGFADVRYHDLRHTVASIYIAEGLDVKKVMYLLGHTRADTTLNIYSYLFNPGIEEGAKAIEKSLNLVNVPLDVPLKE